MLGTETVVLAGEVEYDADNNPVPDTGVPLAVDGCHVEPLDGTDTTASDRSGTSTRLRVFIPLTSGVTGDTVITSIAGRGGPFEIEGDPQPFIDDEDPELSGYVVVAYSAKG
ncbi:head-to-tail stopper [Gordonia phage BBQValindra]|nr:head-to-tail stopper [Gordonia phage BBQValindra]